MRIHKKVRDENSIAKYYNQYLKLMNFWKLKFEDSIFDANYEQIVNSPEKEIKKMISFCNLGWENDCLNFYKNKNIYCIQCIRYLHLQYHRTKVLIKHFLRIFLSIFKVVRVTYN